MMHNFEGIIVGEDIGHSGGFAQPIRSTSGRYTSCSGFSKLRKNILDRIIQGLCSIVYGLYAYCISVATSIRTTGRFSDFSPLD